MPITLKCPACGASIKAPDAAAGKTLKCPKCSGPLTLPSTAALRVATPMQQEPAPLVAEVEEIEDVTPVPTGPRRPAARAASPKMALVIGAACLGVVLLLAIGAWALWIVFRDPTTWADYQPLSVGAMWEYDVEEQDGAQPVQKGTIVQWIEGQEDINGKPYFKRLTVVTGIQGMGELGPLYFRQDTKGIYVFNKKRPALGESLALPDPPLVGAAWTNGKAEVRVEGQEDVHLAGQTYSRCLKVREKRSDKYTDEQHDTYYAPGVGQVKRVSVIHVKASNRDITIVVALRKYTNSGGVGPGSPGRPDGPGPVVQDNGPALVVELRKLYGEYSNEVQADLKYLNKRVQFEAEIEQWDIAREGTAYRVGVSFFHDQQYEVRCRFRPDQAGALGKVEFGQGAFAMARVTIRGTCRGRVGKLRDDNWVIAFADCELLGHTAIQPPPQPKGFPGKGDFKGAPKFGPPPSTSPQAPAPNGSPPNPGGVRPQAPPGATFPPGPQFPGKGGPR
jgi:hypothetical protein